MIVSMLQLRLAGPAALVEPVLRAVQDEAVLHVVSPPAVAGRSIDRTNRHLRRLLDDVEHALTVLEIAPSRPGRIPEPNLVSAARFARRLRRRAEWLRNRRSALDDQRTALLRYREFFAAFESLIGHELAWPDGKAFYVVLRAGAARAVDELREALTKAVGTELELLDRPLTSGEIAVLILVSNRGAPTVAKLLSDSRVQELPAPPGLGEANLLRAMPALRRRLDELPGELEALDAEKRQLATAHGARLEELRWWLHDRLLVHEARARVLEGKHLFVIEGWLPRPRKEAFVARLTGEFGPELVIETVGTERWRASDAPVALENPALFKPFEIVTRMMPLPRYGSIDPTPFLAIFFPAFFGLMLADVGYGLLLAIIAVILRLRSRPHTTLRSVSFVAGACSLFAILFGFLFGELFGTLGHFVGMRPLWFNREEAIVPFLLLAVSLGVVHVSLGLVLAAVTAWRRGHPREAIGRGVATLMVGLTVVALLAAFKLLPAALLTPSVIALLVAFVLLIALEGVVALIELLSTFGHILSYARIMALGTASLMMAVVANQMVGTMGSVVVGVLFALLFHLVNFAIGLFSPTIHGLRLHSVEFLGKFFSPGGAEYRPLAHWQPQHSP